MMISINCTVLGLYLFVRDLLTNHRLLKFLNKINFLMKKVQLVNHDSITPTSCEPLFNKNLRGI